MHQFNTRNTAAALSFMLLCAAASAQTVQIDGAWIRPAVPGQTGTGGFLTLKSAQTAQLVGIHTAAAAVNEVHEMKMDGGVMKMRAVAALDLPAGQAVTLKPGGYHLMLMDLKGPLAVGQKVAVTFKFKDSAGKAFEQQLDVPVASRAPAVQEHKH